MCGIAGFTTFKSGPADAEGVIRLMTAAMIHRGPDGEGYYRDAAVTLGHRRLSIIDLPGGAQPMQDPSGRYTLVYNGEIYNYLELREELERRGCRFVTQSDTEVLLQSLIIDGLAALSRLDGMFAFAMWDRHRRTLLLARDSIGIKPLYYSFDGAELIYASELKALLKHPSLSRRYSPLSVSKYFSFGYVPAPHTIFTNVHKLEPGAWVQFGEDGLDTGFYWDIPLTDSPPGAESSEECASKLLRLLRESVRRQLRSDVPVGVFLSGGIDSSAITVLAAQESSCRLKSFSIGFDQPTYDESAYARRVASFCGTEHHEVIMTLRQATDLFPRVMQQFDEPFGDASVLPTWLLCQTAVRHVKTVLGGDGADELFAGYPSFQAHKVVERLSFLPINWRDRLGYVARRLPVSFQYASLDSLAQQFLKGLGLPPDVRFLLWMGCCGNAEKEKLFSSDFRKVLQGQDAFEDIARYIQRAKLTDAFQRVLYLCLKMYFQDGILVKVDRASMAHSLEVRVPYMDSRLVEYACQLPGYLKLRGLQTKYVLKRALRGLLPDEIINRRKAGFMLPVAFWLGREMRATVEDLCSPAALSATGLFDPRQVRQMLDEHFEHRRDHRKHIYSLACFMAWLRNYGGA